METEIKVLIADDHPIFRGGLREALEGEPGLKIVGEAADGTEALRQIELLRPHVAVLDVEMPRLSGLDVAKQVQDLKLPVELVILTMYKDEDLFNEALALGVKGYVLKDSAATEIIGSIRSVLAGGHYISPSISSLLVKRASGHETLARENPGLDSLTPAEQRVLRLIADGKTSKEIASELFISHRTVENHRTNISNKLNIRGANALLRFALEHKSRLP